MKIFYVLILALFLFQLSKAEYVGVLNISTNSKHIVTGLYGQTIIETTKLTTTTIQTTTIFTTTTTTTTIKPTTTTSTTTTTLPQTYSADLKIKEEEINIFIENLSSILEKHIGKIDINRLKKTTNELINNITIRRELVIGSKSFLTTNIKYIGKEKIKNLIIYDNVSKLFSVNASEIKIFSDIKPIVLEEDPVFLFIYQNISQNDTIFIRYSVEKEVKKDVLNETKTILFLEDFKKDEDTKIILISSIIILIAFIIISYLIISKQKGYGYRYSYKKRNWPISFILKMKIKKLKEKIKNVLKKEREEKFRYQFKK